MAIAYTVAFDGIDARLVEVQCTVSAGLPAFAIVGLPDKSISEARERVRAAFSAMSIALPNRRITVNMSPADLPKEGSHFDLPIALAVLAALEIVPHEALAGIVSLGELALDGRLVAVNGALPAAMAAAEEDRALVCPHACGPEAAWVASVPVLAPRSLKDLIDHLIDRAPLTPATAGEVSTPRTCGDLAEVRGQERARRALEISAAGRHHLLMSQHIRVCHRDGRLRVQALEKERLSRMSSLGRWLERKFGQRGNSTTRPPKHSLPSYVDPDEPFF